MQRKAGALIGSDRDGFHIFGLGVHRSAVRRHGLGKWELLLLGSGGNRDGRRVLNDVVETGNGFAPVLVVLGRDVLGGGQPLEVAGQVLELLRSGRPANAFI